MNVKGSFGSNRLTDQYDSNKSKCQENSKHVFF